jgi:cation transport protein ChaC
MKNIWVFGYGSLIWRPDILHTQSCPAVISGFTRRFWQGSHDHRGTLARPGRVVTLIPREDGCCEGIAYLVSNRDADEVFKNLDHREKNGYRRVSVKLKFSDGTIEEGFTYIANEQNEAFLGSASAKSIALQIINSSGPSGENRDYLYQLSDALRDHGFVDAHVFELDSLVKYLIRKR